MSDALVFLYDWGVPILVFGFVLSRLAFGGKSSGDAGVAPDPLPVMGSVRLAQENDPSAPETGAEVDERAAAGVPSKIGHVDEQGNCSECGKELLAPAGEAEDGETHHGEPDEPLDFCYHCGNGFSIEFKNFGLSPNETGNQ